MDTVIIPESTPPSRIFPLMGSRVRNGSELSLNMEVVVPCHSAVERVTLVIPSEHTLRAIKLQTDVVGPAIDTVIEEQTVETVALTDPSLNFSIIANCKVPLFTVTKDCGVTGARRNLTHVKSENDEE